MLEAMLPYAGATFTVTPDNPRAMKAEELASEAEKIVDYVCGKRKPEGRKKHGAQEIVRREQKIVHVAQELWDRFRRSGHAVP